MKVLKKIGHVVAVAAVVAAVFACDPAVLDAQNPKPQPPRRPATAPAQPRLPNDDQILQAMKAGMKFIYGKIREDGSLPTSPTGQQFPSMVESLALLAGLSAGDSDSTFIRLLAKSVASTQTTSVAGRSARIMAMCQFGAGGMDTAKSDVEWLCGQQQPNGGWNYGAGQPKTIERAGQSDSLNSQWAVWAMGQAADNAINLPREKDIWTKARDFWERSQNSDGGWGYDPPKPSGVRIKGASYGTMTVGGLVSLLILNDRWAAGQDGVGGTEPPDRKATDSAWKWLQANFAVEKIPQYAWGDDPFEHYMYLYDLARLAGQMGIRGIDKKDVLGEITRFLMPQQRKDGSWPSGPGAKESDDDVLYTCMAILCLAEIRKPLLVSMLVPPDTWPGAGSGVSAATRWVCKKLSAQFGWQLLNDDAMYNMYGLAPILFIHCGDKVDLPSQPLKKIKTLLDFDGTVVIQAASKTAAQNIAKSLNQQWPQYSIQDLNKDHPIFAVQYTSPAFAELTGYTLADAVRSRVFIIGADLDAGWRAQPMKYGEFLGNLLLYTTDMVVPTGRWNAPPPRPAAPPNKVVKVGRLRHAGEWNACPRAMDRLSDAMICALRIGVQQVDVDMSKPIPADISLLWITGSGDPQLNPQAQANLKKYITDGGTVFFDSTVGRPEFARAVSGMLTTLFGKDNFKPLPADCPLLTGDFAGGIGSDIRQVEYSRALLKEKPDLKSPELYAIEMNGRISAIVSPYGVTCPLEGLPAYGYKGFSPDDARRLTANVLLYSLGGK